MTIADLVLFAWLLFAVLGIIAPRRRLATLHDPISALFATIADAVGSFGAADVAAGVGADAAAGFGADALGGGLIGSLAGPAIGSDLALASLPELAGGAVTAGGGLADALAGPALSSDLTLASLPSDIGAAATPTLAGASDLAGGASDLFSGAQAAGTTAPNLAGATSLPALPSASSVAPTLPSPAAAPFTQTADLGTGLSSNLTGSVSDAGSSLSGPAAGTAVDTSGGLGGIANSAVNSDLGILDQMQASVGPGLAVQTTPSGDILAGAPQNTGWGSSISNFFKEWKTPLSLLAAGGSLLPMLFQNNNYPSLTTASNAAGTQAATGQALETGAMAGVLPPGYQGVLDSMRENATAQIRSRYAQLGEAGSTAEAEDIANASASIDAQQAAILQNLLDTGVQATGNAAQENLGISQFQFQQDQAFQTALSNLARALMLSNFGSGAVA